MRHTLLCVFVGHMTRGDRKSQVRPCFCFCTADFLSLLAYESAEQKPKCCLTWDFPSALLMTFVVKKLYVYVTKLKISTWIFSISVIPSSSSSFKRFKQVLNCFKRTAFYVLTKIGSFLGFWGWSKLLFPGKAKAATYMFLWVGLNSWNVIALFRVCRWSSRPTVTNDRLPTGMENQWPVGEPMTGFFVQ